jgi:hypothetical protein
VRSGTMLLERRTNMTCSSLITCSARSGTRSVSPGH